MRLRVGLECTCNACWAACMDKLMGCTTPPHRCSLELPQMRKVWVALPCLNEMRCSSRGRVYMWVDR